MKTILFVVPRFHTNLYFATRVLREAGHRVVIFASRQSGGEDHSIVAPIVFGDDPAFAAVEQAWRGFDPDLVLVRRTGDLSGHIMRLARSGRCRLLAYNQRPYTEHQSLASRLRKLRRRESVRRVTPVTTPGPTARPPDPYATYLPWPVLRLPVGPPEDAPSSAGDASRVRILCVGKLCMTRKNQDKLIDAIMDAGLATEVELTLVGSMATDVNGFDREHYRRLEEAARLPWITLRGDVAFKRMPSIYAASDICVLPSVGEPLGTSPVEAMAYGCVPVISRQAGSAGYLRHGETGFVVDMERDGDLASVLRRLVHDAPLRTRLRAAAEEVTRTDLGPERFLQRIESLIAGR